MATAAEQIGEAFAAQVQEMQSESANFSPTNDMLQKAQAAMLESLTGNIRKKSDQSQQIVIPEDKQADFAWIVQQMQAQPFMIPYLKTKVAASLEAIAAAADKILQEQLGTPTASHNTDVQ
jgi:hypothetical protein